MNQLVVGEMGLSGKWLVGETEFGEMSFRRDGIRWNGVVEMGVDETAVGEMGGYHSVLRKYYYTFKDKEGESRLK